MFLLFFLFPSFPLSLMFSWTDSVVISSRRSVFLASSQGLDIVRAGKQCAKCTIGTKWERPDNRLEHLHICHWLCPMSPHIPLCLGHLPSLPMLDAFSSLQASSKLKPEPNIVKRFKKRLGYRKPKSCFVELMLGNPTCCCEIHRNKKLDFIS